MDREISARTTWSMMHKLDRKDAERRAKKLSYHDRNLIRRAIRRGNGVLMAEDKANDSELWSVKVRGAFVHVVVDAKTKRVGMAIFKR